MWCERKVNRDIHTSHEFSEKKSVWDVRDIEPREPHISVNLCAHEYGR